MPGTICEGISLCIGIALFFLANPEWLAYIVHSDAFENGTAEAGLTFSTPAARCFEQDFADKSSTFEKKKLMEVCIVLSIM